ncbi:MAG: Holliday junction branch migration protein RuvA [Thermomicrobiales bacterium]|nr:Holliday junction branch migration protein RuvA [Thermomicrobiales bacterium]
MIAGLRGVVAGTSSDSVLLDVNGVIYRIGATTSTLAELAGVDGPVYLHTHLMVREDAMALYGFRSPDELQLFETVTTVSGIGPRLGVAILSRFTVDQLRNAIQAGDADLLATVPGVGKKTAARMIVELRGKLPSVMAGGASGVTSDDNDVLEALRSLGYNAAEASAAMAASAANAGPTVEERIVAALQFLSSN